MKQIVVRKLHTNRLERNIGDYMKQVMILVLLVIGSYLAANQIEYPDSWGDQGITVIDQSDSGLELNYSIQSFSMETRPLDTEEVTTIGLAGQFLPGEEGCPDLPMISRFIAVPEGARVQAEIISSRQEKYENLQIIPAPRLPLDTETGDLEYNKNQEVYQQNAFYPAQPLLVSDVLEIRGVKVVVVSIAPFQFNPVTGEMLVYRDLKINVEFSGGSGVFGDDRLRSIWWEPILQSSILNYESLPPCRVPKNPTSRTEDYEYIIITPDDPDFLAWADSIAVFRNEQGIRTGVVTTTEVGGNTTTAIESYINHAYNYWDIPPVAVLLLGDYGTSGNTIVSPMWNSYCVSDHVYADVTGNSIADVILARITAQNEEDLEIMIGKLLNNERNPVTDSYYYDHPITALGWQTERWFQICSEAVGGYWENNLGKNRVRINAVYDGNPNTDPWSTATNTTTVINYFGPNGQNYIPATPAELGGWTGGTATLINQAIEAGSFMLVHRDHGGETGWGEPDYGSSNVQNLENQYPIFVFSINCLTGKYNYAGDCFAETFHRHPTGALGLVAASEVSYSFVNDVYMWGVMDNMWPDFLPNLGTNATDCDFILPAFANAAGKLFLFQNNWAYNYQNKPVTYNLFHAHGGAFMNIYSEVPQNLTVAHDDVLVNGAEEFVVTADAGSFIGLSVDGQVIGSGVGTGSPLAISIPSQDPNKVMKVTVTKQNSFRYSSDVNTISQEQYVIFGEVDCVELSGHIDNSIQALDTVQLNVTLDNIGLQPTGTVVNATLSTESNQVTILDGAAVYGQIPASGSLLLENAFQIELLENIEDHTFIDFTLEVESSGSSWISYFQIEVLAPILNYSSFSCNVLSGSDEILDPGETADLYIDLSNGGDGFSYNTTVILVTTNPDITISGGSTISQILPGEIGTTEQPFQVSVAANSPSEYFAEITMIAQDESGIGVQTSFNLPIGFIAHNFENGENGWEHLALGEDWVDEWHLSSYRNFTEGGMFSMKCGDEETLPYANFMYAALVMPEFELGTATIIKFHHWMDVGGNSNGLTWDGGQIEISVNGGDWELVTPEGGYPCTTMNIPNSPFSQGQPVFAGDIDWEEVTLDLSQYSGTAQIRFVLGSCGLVTGEGWYIDDVFYTNPVGTQEEMIVPASTKLLGNYPNPFNPSTTISFYIADDENTEISIYNLKGQKVKQLVNEKLAAGNHSIIWNGKDDNAKATASGVYFYKMKAGKYQSIKKMILLR